MRKMQKKHMFNHYLCTLVKNRDDLHELKSQFSATVMNSLCATKAELPSSDILIQGTCSCIDDSSQTLFFFLITVHGVATQGKQVDITQYVTEFKLSSTIDGIIWNLYKENQTVKVSSLKTSKKTKLRGHVVEKF